MSLINIRRSILIIFSTAIFAGLLGCTIYKSEGRKTFETQSPGQIRTLSLIECSEDMNVSPTDFDQVEYTTNGHEVLINFSNKVYVQVAFTQKQPQQFCTYSANDPDEWEKVKEYFYVEIDAIQNEVLD